MTRRVENAVILDGRAAAMLWTRLGLSEKRVLARDRDEVFYSLLMDIYHTALAWQGSGRGRQSTPPEEQAETRSGRYVTTEEVAAQVGTSSRSIRNAIVRGDLPAIKRGSVWLIDQTDAVAYVASKRAA